MQPRNPSNDVVDPAEEKRTDLPSDSSEQGQVEQPDHNDQVGNSPVSDAEVNQDPAPADAAPAYNDPTRPAPQQHDGEAVTDDNNPPQVGAGEDPDSPSEVLSDTQDSSPQSSSEADSS